MATWLVNRSIRTKINVVLLIVLLAVMVVSMLFTVRSERAMVEETVLQNVREMADSYLDTLNIMMLTGTLAQFKEVHREKVLSHPGVLEARVLRAEHLTNLYGPGQEEKYLPDSLDQQALQGKAVYDIRDSAGGRVLTVLRPVVNETNFRGTNCTNCHLGQGGELLGAIRFSYSLAELDKRINLNLLTLGGVQAVLFIAGLALLSLVFYRVILSPLSQLRASMKQVESDSDLTVRTKVHANDEIGGVATAFNAMLERFGNSLRQVAATTRTLKGSADTIASVADETVTAVNMQYQETDQMACAMEEMQASARVTREHAEHTLQASIDAENQSKFGRSLTDASIQGIYQLTQQLQSASQVIQDLDKYSNEVGKVLDIITAIAEQTNLLALNAAIEAARAGESGRGFAVVADEVRSLANRTYEATKDVQRTIQHLQREADGAVNMMKTAQGNASDSVSDVEKVADALNTIADAVNQIHDLNIQMASAAKEQQEVSGRVNEQVVQIASLAERTSSDATKSSQVSDDLVQLANRLEALVNGFKLG